MHNKETALHLLQKKYNNYNITFEEPEKDSDIFCSLGVAGGVGLDFFYVENKNIERYEHIFLVSIDVRRNTNGK